MFSYSKQALIVGCTMARSDESSHIESSDHPPKSSGARCQLLGKTPAPGCEAASPRTLYRRLHDPFSSEVTAEQRLAANDSLLIQSRSFKPDHTLASRGRHRATERFSTP